MPSGKIKLREIPDLDILIDQAIKKLLTKTAADLPDSPPHYQQLIDDLIQVPTEKHSRSSRTCQGRLVRGLETLQQCYKFGAAKYLLAHPTAISDLMTISGSENVTQENYPDLSDSQRILLKEFNKGWEKSIKPLLAERIEKYGREKLTAEGLTQTVREWFTTNNESIQAMASTLMIYKLQGVIEMLGEVNSNPACSVSLDLLLRPDLEAANIHRHLEVIAEEFTVNESRINPGHVDSIKQGLRNIMQSRYSYGGDSPKDRAAHEAIIDLRDRYWDLVEMPYYETSNVLNIPYRGRNQ